MITFVFQALITLATSAIVFMLIGPGLYLLIGGVLAVIILGLLATVAARDIISVDPAAGPEPHWFVLSFVLGVVLGLFWPLGPIAVAWNGARARRGGSGERP